MVLGDSTLQHLLWSGAKGLWFCHFLPWSNFGDVIRQHYYDPVSVRLIPLRESLLPAKQQNYDWIATKRDDALRTSEPNGALLKLDVGPTAVRPFGCWV